ncbi:unnamed protein product [Parascedosporium putredinis]|uniref:Uncharacterized protein n=1 Tax=Parascedosporium putredinis TaxID=1442378 RepID=A0A9P1M7M5_9PEZI|nr:unnamed protein product [Parascedosporium putredinis]CAI7991960.1 unnamed protein product [Parascedosporium putredinis]
MVSSMIYKVLDVDGSFGHGHGLGLDTTWLESEVNYLASLGSRRTGSPAHNQLIDHIQVELETLGFKVFTQLLTFDYDDTYSLTPGKLSVNGEHLTVASTVPYSGHTPEDGVSGHLISLGNATGELDWAKATGNIAVLNISNEPLDARAAVPLWEGSPDWGSAFTGVPSTPANTIVTGLELAREAGVKGIVYCWENISDALASRLYAPFHTPWFDIPALFVSGETAKAVRLAADADAVATLTLTGRLIPDTPTRNIWVVVPGTETPDESVILSTHTDGTNLVEENGHLAIINYAKILAEHPPKRTHILLFVTAHIHSAPFSNTKRSTTRWLLDNPEVWNGSSPAVFATCVEHLGAVAWKEDVRENTYVSTNEPHEELLYAATPELASLLYQNWNGAIPHLIRVANPNKGPQLQPGKGYRFGKRGSRRYP